MATRPIEVSTEVFAQIWSRRRPGEDTEDAILRRILCGPSDDFGGAGNGGGSHMSGGFRDRRHNVVFPEGFEIFRTYLGRKFIAHATGGKWVLVESGKACSGLNELSRSVGAKTENAWQNWFYINHAGDQRPVSDLRDPRRIATRGARVKSPSDGLPAASDGGEGMPQAMSEGTWRDDVWIAIERLGGRASLSRIYREAEMVRRSAARSIPRTLEAIVRRTLEDHSSDSENYRGGPDLFWMPDGKGAGVWANRERKR